MSAWTQALSTALVDFLWQGAIVGLLLWSGLAAMQRRSANARYAVSCLAFAALAVLPLLTITALIASSTAPPPIPAPIAVRPVAVMPQTLLPIWMVSDTPRIAWLDQVQLWALPLWSFGVVLFSMRLAWGCRHAFTIRHGEPYADQTVLSILGDLVDRVGISRPIRLIASSLTDGPAVVGWLRPAILLPPATAMGLTPEQLRAVLAHELAHIKRHDYIVNMLQVITETLFFYHPVVWWVSRQIRIERELCCDDIAVRSCGDAVGYARALTTLARRQLGAPALAMGATSGSLLYRVQRLIGATPAEHVPSRTPTVIVASLVIACLVLNLDWLQAFSQSAPRGETPRFEVASIKVNRLNDNRISISTQNGRFRASGISLGGLLRSAYQVQEFQIVNGPDWIDSVRFDLVAKEPDNVAPPAPGTPGPTPQQMMLRALLEDRFALAVHKETRELPVYALVLARKDGTFGPQLKRATSNCSETAARGRAGAGPGPWESNRCGTSVGPGLILAGDRTMAQIATAFSTLTNTGSSLNRLVVDRTGLEGTFDLTLRFTPDNIPNFGPGGPPADLPAIDPNGPSIFTAVQEQLGLKLESQRGPVEVLVIDRVQHPTED